MAQGRFFKEQIATLDKVGVGTIEPSESIETTGNIKLADNGIIKLGDGNDLQLLHNGSDSIIKDVGTGNLELHATNLVFRNHLDTAQYASFINGGAVSLYYNNILKLSTSASGATIHGDLSVGDGHFIGNDSFDNLTLISSSGENVVVAAANDIYLNTDASGGGTGTNRVLINESGTTLSGNLTLSYAYPRINLTDTNNDSDYSIINNDGSFSIYDVTNASHRFLIAADGNATFDGNLKLNDSKQLQLGNDADLQFYSDNTQTLLLNNNNDLIIKQEQLDGDIKFLSDNGSGGSTEYFRLDGGIVKNVFSKTVNITGDLEVGTTILHTAGNFNYISSQDASKDLIIRNTGSGKDMVLQVTSSGGTAELFRLRGVNSKEIVSSANFEIRNGTSSRHINLYETYTDSSNYERSFFKHASSFLEIGTEAAGTGTASGLKLKTGGNDVITIGTDQKVKVGGGTNTPSLGGGTVFRVDMTQGAGNYASIAILGGNTGRSSLFFGDLHAEQRGALDYRHGDDSLSISTAAGERMRILSDGNVGIGTTNPQRKLEVAGGIRTNNDGIQFTDSNAFINRGGSYMQLRTYAGNDIILMAGGDVGIGTTTPAHKLDVSGSARLLATAPTLTLQDSDESNVFGQIIQSSGAFTIRSRDGSNHGDIRFERGNGSTIVENARFDSSGRLGIGTTTIPHLLSVKGTISRLGSTGIQIINLGSSSDHGQLTINNSGGTTRVALNSSGADSYISAGNFGIGTTSPNALLHVKSTGNGEIEVERASGALINIQAQSARGVIGTDSNHPLSLKTNAGERVHITTDGRVGINTVPHTSQQLHIVASPTDTTGLEFSTSFVPNESRILSYDRGSGGGYRPLRLQTSHLKVEISGTQKFAVTSTGASVTGRLSASEVAVTNIVTNKLVKFNGTLLDDSSITDDGSTVTVGGNLTVQGDISTTGTFTIIDTDVNTTEQLLVTNDGTGPAAIINQKGVQPIVDFQDDSTSVFYIKNGGNVGIGNGITNPLNRLHVETSDSTVARFKSTTNKAAIFVSDDDTGGYFSAESGRVSMGFNSGLHVDNINIHGSSGNFHVGIGTTSPSSKLTVDSNVSGITAIDADANAAAPITWRSSGTLIGSLSYSSSSAVLRANSGGLLFQVSGSTEGGGFNSNADFFVDTDTLYVDASESRVGIGTTSPARELSVVSSTANAVFQLTNSTAGSTADNGLEIFSSGVDTGIVNRENGYLRFDTNNVERMRILSDGKVGINDTVPQGKLQIDAGGDVNAIHLVNSGQNSSNFASRPISIIFGDEQKGASARHQASINCVREAWSSTPAALTFKTATGVNTATERMRIASDGKVGIGTTSPSQKLDISAGWIELDTAYGIQWGGTANRIWGSGGNNYIKIETNGVERLRVDGQGDVGIGVTDPDYKLHVNGAIAIKGGELADTARIHFQASDESNRFTLESDFNSTTTTDLLGFRSTTADNILVLKGNGNVGIGVTNPSQKLEVGTNTDVSAQIGRAHIGHISFGDHAGFSHLDAATSSGYALLQSSAGDTFINSPAGRHIYFRKGNATIGGFNGNSDFYVDTDTLYVDSSEDRVGIGVNDPDATLEIKSTGTSVATEAFRVRNANNTELFRIEDNGVVTVPSQYFYAASSAGAYVQHDLRVRGSLLNDQGTLVVSGDVNFDSNTLFVDSSDNRVGIGTASPAEKLDVKGTAKIGSNSTTNCHLIGSKGYSLTGSFTTGLTVTLADHTACHVKVFISGDWGNHSSVAYVGEFLIQNTGNVGSYNEPGIILTEYDNLTSDRVAAKIVDGTTDNFEIQFQAVSSSSTGLPVSAKITYHVMGDASAVS